MLVSVDIDSSLDVQNVFRNCIIIRGELIGDHVAHAIQNLDAPSIHFAPTLHFTMEALPLAALKVLSTVISRDSIDNGVLFRSRPL